MYDIKESRAIITGSAQGLGKEYARRLLENGCKVCLSDIDEVQGLETKTQFQKQFRLKGDQCTTDKLFFISADTDKAR